VPWTTGGDYHAFAVLIKKTLICWNRVGIVPYFVFDGENLVKPSDHDLAR
jgi:hypothetical protein